MEKISRTKNFVATMCASCRSNQNRPATLRDTNVDTMYDIATKFVAISRQCGNTNSRFENFRKNDFSPLDSRFEHRPDVKSLFESDEKISILENSIQSETLK